MKITVRSGSAMAAAAATLVIAGVTTTAPTPAAADYKVKCFGLNACKGHGSCKSMQNACKGHNACKGQGFRMTSRSKCMKMGGHT